MLHVRVGKGQHVDGGAELDRYQRLSRELAAVQLKLDDAVTGGPSAAELPAHLERAAAERDHLAAISRLTRTPGQRHALARAERRVAELAAAEAAFSGPRKAGALAGPSTQATWSSSSMGPRRRRPGESATGS